MPLRRRFRRLAAHFALWWLIAAPLAGASELAEIAAVATQRLPLPRSGIRGLHWQGGTLWLLATENRGLSAPDSSYVCSLLRYSPESRDVQTVQVEIDAFETGLSSDGRSFWSGGSLLGSTAGLYQLEPRGGEILQVHPLRAFHLGGLAFDGGHLWQVDADGRKLLRLDPEDGKVSRKVVSPGLYPTGLAYDGAHFWCADAASGRLYRLRGTNARADGVVEASAFHRPGEFVSLAWDGRALWSVGASDSFAVRLELVR